MKKNLKLLLIIVSAIILAGCFNKLTPSERVEDMMNKYIKNDPELLEELDDYILSQDLSSEQKERYKSIIKDEYASLKYEIKDETVNGDDAEVTLDIEVKDLYSASKSAGDYLLAHSEEFYNQGVYDQDKFIDYKLSLMEETTKRVEYTITMNLKNRDEMWTILELDNVTLEKIHGIYDYDADNVE